MKTKEILTKNIRPAGLNLKQNVSAKWLAFIVRIRKALDPISAIGPEILTEIVHGFPRFLHEFTGIVI